MKSPVFDAAYSHLNTQQREAVDTIDGPVMVIAGPGTGKTQVLATRIANILLKTDTPPYALLALTFTEAAAINMKERIVGLIGQPGHYVNVTTFHSFCSDVIRSYPDYFPIDPKSQPLSDLESYSTIDGLLQALPLDILKPINSPTYYISAIRSMLSTLKREGVLPSDLLKHIEEYEKESDTLLSTTAKKEKEKILLKNKELLLIYVEYQKKLREMKRFDYDDMISLVVEALRVNEELLSILQEKYHYFLVDEYQDTNSAQNAVVRLLASFWGEEANIFVVGDPHQSIFRFQGASIENILSFATEYPNANIVTLTQGYRCTKTVYDSAHTLILHNELTNSAAITNPALQQALNTPIQAQQTATDPIEWTDPVSIDDESIQITKRVKEQIQSGVSPGDIAILYRNNADGDLIEEVLTKFDIPLQRDRGISVLDIKEIQQLLSLFTLVSSQLQQIPTEETTSLFFDVCLFSWSPIDDLLVYQLALMAGKSSPKQSIQACIEQGYDSYAKKLGASARSAIEFYQAEAFLGTIQRWATLSINTTLPEWLETVLNESGFMKWALSQESCVDILNAVRAFFTYCKNRAQEDPTISIPAILEECRLMQEYGITLPLVSQTDGKENPKVTLSTAHSAKGREWEYVYIIRCLDKKWGNNQNRELIKLIPGLVAKTDEIEKERNEDERRLFYVSLTRAKKQVILSTPRTVPTAHTARPVAGSMFISEIEEYVEKSKAPEVEDTEETLQILLQPTKRITLRDDIRMYLKSVIDTFVWTPTALNSYLQNPKDFLYATLLRLPKAKEEHFAYGTAIHSALEHMYKGYIANKPKIAPIQAVLTVYEQALAREILTSTQYQRRLVHGKEVLKRYYDQYGKDGSEPFYLETVFGMGLHKTVLDGIPLRGRIDRIDWIDKKTNRARVIDYKTGKSRTENEIKGLTVSSGLTPRELELPESIRGGYKRQLLFYKLLCQLDPYFQYEIEEGVFDFVEPDKTSGKFIRRTFQLPQEDIEDLKKLIKEIHVELRTLKFLDDLDI